QLPSQIQSDLRNRQPEYRQLGNLVQRSPVALDQALQPWTLGRDRVHLVEAARLRLRARGQRGSHRRGDIISASPLLRQRVGRFRYIASNFKGNVTYHIPAFNNTQSRIAKALNGWWIASIVSMQSGLPINPLIGNRSLSNNPGAAGSVTDRPDLDPSF